MKLLLFFFFIPLMVDRKKAVMKAIVQTFQSNRLINRFMLGAKFKAKPCTYSK